MTSDLNTLTVGQLRFRAQGLGLRLGGKKAELVERIEEHLEVKARTARWEEVHRLVPNPDMETRHSTVLQAVYPSDLARILDRAEFLARLAIAASQAAEHPELTREEATAYAQAAAREADRLLGFIASFDAQIRAMVLR